ncbi:MAG: arabinofuranosyltransferase [Myxococcota bacterium]|jgi:arabinofuranosyltransferase
MRAVGFPCGAVRTRLAITLCSLFIVLVVVVQCAWVSDDAYITLRVADNLLGGHGLRWNVIERVQAYTHPLWLAGLVPAFALTGDAYTGAWALGALTTAAAVLALLIQGRPGGGMVAVAGFVSSKALVDYATSGLENPLTHLLLAGLLVAASRRALLPATLLGSALALARPDAVLFAVPTVGWLAWAEGRAWWRSVFLGLCPLIGWELFSLAYYGALVPNTALAKLAHGIPRAEVLGQGLSYAAHTVLHDGVTALLVLAGPALALVDRRGESVALAAGAVLYCAYVAWVGGDFMAGRFWTGPAFVGLLLIARVQLVTSVGGVVAGLVVVAGLLAPGAPLRSGRDYQRIPAWNGIVDERGYYHRAAGLFGPAPNAPRPDHPWVRDGRTVRANGGPSPTARACVGYFGFFAGPGIHVTDRLALADPLLARLPAEYDPSWRIGHFRRGLPAGHNPAEPSYTDPALTALAADVRTITQGPLFTWDRLAAIARLTARPHGEVDPAPYRFHHIRTQPVHAPLQVPERGLAVPISGRTVSLDRGRGGGLRVVAARGLTALSTWDVPGTTGGPRFQTWRAPLPSGADHLLMFPLDPKHPTRVGRVVASQ